jgi:hypothetical protein
MAINTQMDHQVMLAPHNDFSAPQGDLSAPHDAHFFAPHGIDFPVVETHQSRNRHAREESRDLPLRPHLGFTLFRADETFERLDHLFAGLDNVADEGNIPTERSTTNILDQRLPAPPAPSAILILDKFGNILNERSATNILDQNLPAPTAKPTVNDFAIVTDAVAWMNEHKQCHFLRQGFCYSI